MNKLKIFFFFLIFGNLAICFAQYPTINTNRPRIYIDAERFEFLKSKLAVPGDFKTDYDYLISMYNSTYINDSEIYLSGSNQSVWNWNWESGKAKYGALVTAFIYKVSNDSLALERCKFLAQKAILSINTANFKTMDYYEKENYLRLMSDVASILYDWCFNDFSVDLRNQLAQSLFTLNTEFMNTFILSSEGTNYVSGHNTYNTILCNQNVLVLYNSPGLTSTQNESVLQWYQTIYDKLINEFLPVWSYYRDDDGGWNWGAAYAMWRFADQFQLFENMRIGTSKNFFKELSWLKNSINQYLYFIQPDNKCIHLGDGLMNLQADKLLFLHAKHFNDNRSQWLAQYWSLSANREWTGPFIDKVFFNDYTIPFVNKPENPLNWWSDKVGLAVSRSSWKADATMITFTNSPTKGTAHEHRDNNSFTIFKNAPLLLDSGYYDTFAGNHYINYYQRSIAHNTILVYNASESFSFRGRPAVNDGGQIALNEIDNYNEIFQPESQRSTWIKYAAGDNYQYNVADAQLAYNPNKLDLFRRKLLYVKQNKLLVLDKIHLKKIETNANDIKWIAHFANKPIINGNITNTEVSGHIETFNGQDYKASNGNGNLAIRTLLPAKTTTTLIGGVGYEYLVNGKNYPPNVTPNLSYYTPGSWRIEVKPTELNSDGNVIYFHTIAVGDTTNPSVVGGTVFQNEDSIVADWDNILFFFASDFDVQTKYHQLTEIHGERNVTIFAVDLLEGSYNVKVNATKVSTINVDSNGVLQTSVILPKGNNTIEIVETDAIVNDEIFISVYPNPANTEINIIVTNSSLKVTYIEIFNSIGQLVLKKSINESKVDISTLAKGVYILKMKLGKKYYLTKFLKE